MTDIKANPCHRCGQEPLIVVKRHFDATLLDFLDDNYLVICTNCGRRLLFKRKYYLDAVVAWNRRNRL